MKNGLATLLHGKRNLDVSKRAEAPLFSFIFSNLDSNIKMSGSKLPINGKFDRIELAVKTVN